MSYRNFSGWRMVVLCSITQNCALGLGYGSFGPLLASTEQHFHVTRAVAAVGMSLITFAISLLSPLVGGLLQRVSVRSAMIFAAAFSATGYWGLALLPYFGAALVMYAFIGSGICLLAILGPLVIVNRWFVKDRAKILSLVNLPVMMFAAPFVIAELLPLVGRFAILGGIGSLFLVLIPLLFLLIDDPARIGQTARGAELEPPARGAELEPLVVAKGEGLSASPVSGRAIITSVPFWLLSFAIGAIAGSGTAFLVHIIPFGTERGMTLQSASALLSIYASSGIFGTLLFGWICDKIGSQVAVFLSAVLQALLWVALLYAEGPALFLVAAALGICVVPLVTYHGAALSELFGPERVSRAMGYSYAVKMPFLFCFAPFVGVLFDRSGGYRQPFLATAGIMATAALALFVMLLITRGRRNHAIVSGQSSEVSSALL